jgi:ADP-ribose pyrophosphatase YjhB (NUDIX family)
MRKTVSAGGVVVKKIDQKLKILLVIFSDGTGLGFPKGHVKEGESIEGAALREVSEETGLNDLKIIKKLGIVTRPSVENDGTKVEKDIYLFLMKTTNYNHSKADENYGWFSLEEAINKLGFPQEAEFLKKNLNNLSSN